MNLEPTKMKPITYLKGDATAPQSTGNKIIAHVCNDMGRWGKGFVLALSKRWTQPEEAYQRWYQQGGESNFALGEIQIVQVEAEVSVANMIGQHKIKPYEEVPIRYDAVERCLEKLSKVAKNLEASVHMPRIGCGLAGGKWEKIEPLIVKHLCEQDMLVSVYDYDEYDS
jgi:O-acetyl-ADP-ribose deacetylase (regulator of RNase III)